MRKKRRQYRFISFPNRLLASIVLIILLFLAILLLRSVRQNRQIFHGVNREINITQIDIDITPTVFPTSREGWLTFVNPTGNYRFEYPSDWKVSVSKNRYVKENIYDVRLSYFQNNKSYVVHFMTGGRGGPNYDYKKIKYNILGGKTTQWTIMYLDNKPFEAVVTFPKNDFDKYFIGLYIYLPPLHQEEFIKTLEAVIASIQTRE